MGSIYKRGSVYWIKYYRNGKAYRESSGSKKHIDAKRLLKKREGEISNGKIPGIYFDRVKFDDLKEELIRDYKINKKKSLERLKFSLKHLQEFFGGDKVTAITSSKINEYVDTRLKDGAANATINRELAALKRMLNLGARQTPPKVNRIPYIQMLEEDNTRTGFFEHEDFLALRKVLPDYLKGLVTFAYHSGWRWAEITNLKWNRVDLREGIVSLDAGKTKNKEARSFYLDDELKEVFEAQHEKRKSGNLSPYVFPAKDGKNEIRDIRGAWRKACKDANLGNRLFHDFRRTAVRNMVRSGISEQVAMIISGHKTRPVFDRYNIVNNEDLKEAAQKQEAHLKSLVGTITGTVGESGGSARGTERSQVVDLTGAGGRNRTDTVPSTTGF